MRTRYAILSSPSGGVGLALLAAFLFWELSPEQRKLRTTPASPVPPSSSYTVAGALPRLNVLHADAGGRLYAIEDHHLYLSTDGGETFVRKGALPKPEADALGRVKDIVARSKLVRQLRGNRGPTSIEVLASGTILVFWDKVFRSTDGGASFHVALDPRELGVEAGPFGFGLGSAVGPDDTVYVSEYKALGRPQSALILRGRDDGTRWEQAYRFEPGRIFHVHSITYDPYRQGYWVATGDTDAESMLLFTPDDFRTLTPVGGGSQDWRIVSLIPTPDYLYWGSDNDRAEGAAIFRWDIRRRRLEKLADIGKVSYYSTRLADGTLVVSTTYEPESAYTRANNPDPASEVWFSRDGERWQQLLALPYEPAQTPWGPARAQIAFPGGRPLDRLYLMPSHTAGNPFETVVLELR